MAGGVCTVEFVASVLREGLMGSFGFAYSKPEAISTELRAIRKQATGPVNANFFVFQPVQAPSADALRQAADALRPAVEALITPADATRPLAGAQDLPAESVDRPSEEGELGDSAHLAFIKESVLGASTPEFYPSLHDQLEAVWPERPEVLSFHFGVPPHWVFERAHADQIPVLISATKLEEALAIEASGACAIIAQGPEAGGHRGCFDPKAPLDRDDASSTIELVRVLARHCKLPVIAAGGIMNAEDIQAALAQGAKAVQMGTAFLACHESGASPEHKRLLTGEPGRGTVLTRAFSGRLARGLRNEFTAMMQSRAVLDFPLQNSLTAGLRQQSARAANPEYQSLWAGSAYAKCRSESVSDLVLRLEQA